MWQSGDWIEWKVIHAKELYGICDLEIQSLEMVTPDGIDEIARFMSGENADENKINH